MDYFKEALEAKNYQEMRAICRKILIELIDSGEFTITLAHQQEDFIQDTIGQIILGVDRDDGGVEIHTEPHPKIKNYKIFIKSISDKAISYKTPKFHNGDYKYAGRVNRVKFPVLVDEMYYPNGEDCREGEFDCQTAWRIMHQHGKYCFRAKSLTAQAISWWFEDAPIKKEAPKKTTKKKTEYVKEYQNA